MSRAPGRGDLAAAAALWALAAAWTWGGWADLWVDYGLELELPRRLAAGDVLYRDVFHKNGPLSPYLNALLFRAFGARLETLTAANLAVSLGVLLLLHRMAWRVGGRWSAAAAAAVYAGVFAFGQYLWTGNFNFAAPYSHAQTHGVALGLGAVLAWSAWLERGGRPRAALAGALTGLAFLGKAELFVPVAAVAALALAASLRRAPRPQGAAAAAACLAPPAAAWALLAGAMPAGDALRGVLGNWAAPVAPFANPFYRLGLGLDDPAARAAALAAGGAVLAALAGLAAGLDKGLGPRAAARPRAAAAAAFLLFAAGSAALLPLREAALAVEPAVWALAAAGAWGLMRRPPADPLPALWAVYAAALLAKMALHPRFWQYGFALALPGAALVAARLLAAPPLARAALAGAVAAVVASHLAWTASFHALKTRRHAPPADSVRTYDPRHDPRGLLLDAFLAEARRRLPPGASVLALPEGSAVNFLLGARNPSPFLLFLPEDLLLFGGEAAAVARLELAPPDFVVLLSRETREFGVGPFGSPGYGEALLAWVRSRYREEGRVGDDPLGAGFGLSLWKRR